MLAEVRIENFKGIRKLALDLRFSQAKAPGGYKKSEFLTFIDGGINKSSRVVPALGIFGPNASGKTTILTATQVLKSFVTKHFNSEFFYPNKLISDSEAVKKSKLGLTFYGLNKRFDYDIEYDASGITEESLSIDGNNEFLVRNGIIEFLSEKLDDVSRDLTSEFKVRCVTAEAMHQVRSLLWCLKEEFPGIGKKYSFAYKYIDCQLFILPTNNFPIGETLDLLVQSSDGNTFEEKKKNAINRTSKILKKLDTKIETFDFRRVSVEPSATGEFKFFDTSQVKLRTDIGRLEKIEIDTFHKNDNGELVAFNLFSEESAGTQRIAALVPLFLWAVSTGKTIFIDELESSLHPLLLTTLVEMFKQKRFNNNRAQIIFTTHCTELLETEILKLSEVALIDQRGFGGKQIMKLSEVPKLRNANDFRRRYLRGDFGGVPYPCL